MKRLLPIAIILIASLLKPLPVFANDISDQPSVEIFFSAGCSDCWPYTQDVLIPALRSGGISAQYQVHDFTIPEERHRLSDMIDDIGLPRSIADSLYAFIPTSEGMLVVLGHVPAQLIEAALQSPDLPQKLVIWQPKMHGDPTEYKLWAWKGEVQTFPIETSFDEALTATINASGVLPVGLANLSELLPAVLVTGLVDSVNPCAFAVILLLIAFLFTLRQSRARILQLGFAYIAMIFVVYFSIGLGLLRVIRLSDDPHFIARVGSWLLIFLGSINLIEFFFPKFPFKLHMPAFVGDRTYELIKKATLPATLVAGFLVGLCTFPCSGGIYVSIITLLNAKTTQSWGLVYLLLYNLMFVLPLVIILLALGNRLVAKKWAGWERQHSLKIRLWYGLVMVAMGIIMLILVI
ncbi:MAG TPA: cytochrome c biogenesis protein CcdA [Anaerolineaceae bacterium]|nr:cytochrome c biogenesis protein CcdA [Anaerolineaceae bacterium]